MQAPKSMNTSKIGECQQLNRNIIIFPKIKKEET